MSDKILDILSQAIEKSIQSGANAADAIIYDSADVTVAQRLGKPEHIERAESKALGLRVMIGNKDGYSQAVVSSTDISSKAMDEMVQRAVDMAKISPVDAHASLAPKTLLAKKLLDLDLYDGKEPSVEQLKDWAAEAESAAMEVKGITNSEGSEASYSAHKVALATSNGFLQSYRSSNFSISASVVAGEDQGKETDYDYSIAHHAEDLKSATLIGRTAGERTIRKLNPKKAKTAQVPIVFESRVARSLLRSFASAINGSSVAKGTSFLANKMDAQIFANSINVYDDPLIKRGIASEPFDDEGVRGKKLQLIANGHLRSWILDVRSANKLGLQTTGHAARGTSSIPHPSPSNLYMQAGSVSVKELIGDIKSGFFVTDTFGMGVNGVTGDYSQGAAGFWIEKGEISYAVSEVTIAGNLLHMFKNMTPADDLEFVYGTNCPTLRIEGMTVAGV